MKNFGLISVLSIGGLLFSSQNLDAAEQEIIIEDLSRAELRAEIIKIENEFYRVFNASTNKEYLKVECSEFKPINSHIKRRFCEPEFLVDARSENAKNWQNNVDTLRETDELRSALVSEFEELTVEMNEILAQNEYFSELNKVLRMLRARMQELEQ
jgi:hypothetical protein